jgi:hypothetical protein
MNTQLATWFEARELGVHIRWSSPLRTTGFVAMQFAHWEFLFAIAFACGLYVLHALSRIQEGEEVSERTVIRNFALETGRGVEQMVSSAATSLAALFPVGLLFDRRKRSRQRPVADGGAP